MLSGKGPLHDVPACRDHGLAKQHDVACILSLLTLASTSISYGPTMATLLRDLGHLRIDSGVVQWTSKGVISVHPL